MAIAARELRFSDIGADAAALQKAHGRWFLLITGVGGRVPGQLVTRDASGGGAGLTPDAVVVPLDGRQSPVTIGRAKNNDLVIADASVSTFHAALTALSDGTWAVHDGGSKNGTFVAGAPAPLRGDGEALALEPGRALRIGSVDLLFLDAATLVALRAPP